jgi:hypothetical protein
VSEEDALRLLQNRMLRTIFGPTRERERERERQRSDRKVGKHNAEHQDLYVTPNIIKVIRWKEMRQTEIVESMATKINAYRGLDEKQEKRVACKSQAQLAG